MEVPKIWGVNKNGIIYRTALFIPLNDKDRRKHHYSITIQVPLDDPIFQTETNISHMQLNDSTYPSIIFEYKGISY